MSWKLKEYSYAGHQVKIRYRPYSQTLEARISGPRAGSSSNERFANNVKWKIKSKLPLFGPRASQIDDNVWPVYKEARERIDKAIAAHAKKYEDDYQ